MSRLLLYTCELAPPSRFVLMTADVLGIQLDYKHVDLFKGEQHHEDFVLVNPLKKVPVLIDGGLTVTDSSAIAIYLCDTKGNTSLYPQSPEIRAKINEMLFYHSGILFPQDSSIMSEYFAGKQPLDGEKIRIWNNSLDFLELKLKGNKFLAGDMLSLADLCCAATITSLNLISNLDVNRHKCLNEWLQRVEEQSCYYINASGLKKLEDKINEYKKK